jgi:hypothetical protein
MENDPDVLQVARAIAERGIGRYWDDFPETDAFGTDQGDLIEYARAAVEIFRRSARPVDDAQGKIDLPLADIRDVVDIADRNEYAPQAVPVEAATPPSSPHIVERLRAGFFEREEAANEIERLREELESAKAQITIALRTNGFQLLEMAVPVRAALDQSCQPEVTPGQARVDVDHERKATEERELLKSSDRSHWPKDGFINDTD